MGTSFQHTNTGIKQLTYEKNLNENIKLIVPYCKKTYSYRDFWNSKIMHLSMVNTVLHTQVAACCDPSDRNVPFVYFLLYQEFDGSLARMCITDNGPGKSPQDL